MLLNYSVEVNVWKSFLGIGGWELAESSKFTSSFYIYDFAKATSYMATF